MFVTGQNPAGEPLALGRETARRLALAVGFSEAGVTALPYESEARDAQRFVEWVQSGKAGTMQYLERTNAESRVAGQLIRSRTAIAFPWARSAILCFANYQSARPRSIDSAPDGAAWIARYAWSSRTDSSGVRRPSDYHKVLKKKLANLEAQLRSELGQFDARAFVDTGPVVERALATAAGLGWTGKNTCLIHPRLGSFGFLAVLLTSLPVEAGSAQPLMVPDRCGSCTRCLDACPTGALIAPRQMDARRCISYLTIEHRGEIDAELLAGMGRQVFGCDICQDVCPWNRKAPIATDPDLLPREELVNPSLDWLAELDESTFEKLFNGSPVRRAGFNGLRRNVAIAMGNNGAQRFLHKLTAWQQSADAGLRAAARWSLARLKSSADLPQDKSGE
jgi:epoxyqueuosine reductase